VLVIVMLEQIGLFAHLDLDELVLGVVRRVSTTAMSLPLSPSNTGPIHSKMKLLLRRAWNTSFAYRGLAGVRLVMVV
jgi:hypothetical protein